MTQYRKLTRGQLRSITIKLHGEQGGVCPLCQRSIDLSEKNGAVLDHCHLTGRVRGVLHRSCNSMEGKVFSAAGRWCVGKMDYELVIPALRRLADYLEKEPHPYIYHSFKDESDKREIRAARERKRRAEQKARRAIK